MLNLIIFLCIESFFMYECVINLFKSVQGLYLLFGEKKDDNYGHWLFLSLILFKINLKS